MMQRHTSSYQHSRGAVLFVALILLLAMTIIGVAAIDTTTMESQMSRNSQEANNRYQYDINEIEGQIHYATVSSTYLENIVTSTTTINASSYIGVSKTGKGLKLTESSNIATTKPTNYTRHGYAVFQGFYTGAFHGFSLGKNKQVPIEFNIITTLDGTNSKTDQSQAVLFPAPGGS